jgi:hypothetical protein
MLVAELNRWRGVELGFWVDFKEIPGEFNRLEFLGYNRLKSVIIGLQ